MPLRRERAARVVLTAGILALHGAAPAVTLGALTDGEAESLFRRVPGCEVRIRTGPTLIAAVASASWVGLRVDERLVEAPVVFRDRDEAGPEVRFSATQAAGQGLRGALSVRGDGMRCGQGPDCMAIPARLQVRHVGADGIAQVAFDGDVVVTDPCARDGDKRLFRATSWWERLLRSIAGH
jgi:hypothetical protein